VDGVGGAVPPRGVAPYFVPPQAAAESDRPTEDEIRAPSLQPRAGRAYPPHPGLITGRMPTSGVLLTTRKAPIGPVLAAAEGVTLRADLGRLS
jgi:hypothetical protein